jgi:hypothetical protein
MTNPTTPPDDKYQIRCRKLGHQIFFSYCRSENSGLPCPKAIECWADHFEVFEHLKTELTPEEWESSFESPPKPKMSTLLDLIENAKKAKECINR